MNEDGDRSLAAEEQEAAPRPPPGFLVVGRVALLVTLAVISAWVPLLAVPAAFLAWVGWLSLPRMPRLARRRVRYVFAVAGVAATVGLVRFVVEYAAAGIVGGGQTATSRRAISRLREVVFAQDMMRKNAFLDPDGDGVGSAALLVELSGGVPLRGSQPLDIPVLSREWQRAVDTPVGPATRAGGFLFVVCLPQAQGYTAQIGEAVDEERAERRFLVYAWPSADRPGFDEVYFADEHERILVGRAGPDTKLPYIGPAHPPPCDAALVQSGPLLWESWQNKLPRKRLPGDVR